VFGSHLLKNPTYRKKSDLLTPLLIPKMNWGNKENSLPEIPSHFETEDANEYENFAKAMKFFTPFNPNPLPFR
jgi:hypothetical protein